MGSKSMQLTVNGHTVELDVDPDTSLLQVLRDELGYVGVRSGCNAGFCGSCTVLADDEALPSCDTPVGELDGRAITTPEGLGTPDQPGAVQRIFLREQAAQCGFCINGIIMATEAARRRGEPPQERGAPAWLDDAHLCRCGTHVRVLAAIRRALGSADGEVDDGPEWLPNTALDDPTGTTDELSPDAPAGAPDPTRTSAWLRLLDDGRVAVLTGRVEFGQGVREALATIAAAQLGLQRDRLVVWSVTTGVNADERFTAGSNSVDTGGAAVARAAVAFARELRSRAGRLLGVPTDEVTIGPDGVARVGTASVSLEELAATGPVDVPILDEDQPDWSLPALGEASIRADLVPKLTGAPAYVHDLRSPGMLHARVLLPPTYDASLVELDPGPARALPGVVRVVVEERLILVIADREGLAERAVARLALDARWTGGALPTTSVRIHDHLRDQPSVPFVVRDDAEFDADVHQASYRVPYHAHAPIAPSCAVAQVRDGRVHVRTHSQGVYPLRATLAALLDRPEDEVVVSHQDGPGCYGHNLADDAAALAALAAEAIPGRPVSFRFSLEDEFTWEPYGSAMSIDLTGSIDASGRIAALEHRARSDLHTRRPNGDPDALLVRWLTHPGATWPPLRATEAAARNAEPLYAIDRLTAVADHVAGPLRTSSLRTLGAFANTFASESFVDELAVLAARDPVAFRLDHLEDERASAVLRAAAARVGWEPRTAPTGRGTGIALARYKGQKAYVAAVAEVSVDPDTAIVTVSRITAVCDAGRIVDADGARNQLEGGIVQGLSRTLREEVRFTTSGITSRDWAGYPILGFTDVPEIDVVLQETDEPPLGLGEASLGPTAAAVANALDDALGVRFRQLPLTPEHVREQLYALEEAELERVIMPTSGGGDA